MGPHYRADGPALALLAALDGHQMTVAVAARETGRTERQVRESLDALRRWGCVARESRHRQPFVYRLRPKGRALLGDTMTNAQREMLDSLRDAPRTAPWLADWLGRQEPAVYRTLLLLEQRGMVSRASGKGRAVFSLTDAGRAVLP